MILSICVVVAFSICNCDLGDWSNDDPSTYGGPGNVAMANELLDEAEQQLLDLGIELPPSVPGESVQQRAQRLMEIAQRELNNLDGGVSDNTGTDSDNKGGTTTPHPHTFEDFKLDLPDHGISVTTLPDGLYTLKSATLTFEGFDDKIKGGATGQIKITDPVTALHKITLG